MRSCSGSLTVFMRWWTSNRPTAPSSMMNGWSGPSSNPGTRSTLATLRPGSAIPNCLAASGRPVEGPLQPRRNAVMPRSGRGGTAPPNSFRSPQLLPWAASRGRLGSQQRRPPRRKRKRKRKRKRRPNLWQWRWRWQHLSLRSFLLPRPRRSRRPQPARPRPPLSRPLRLLPPRRPRRIWPLLEGWHPGPTCHRHPICPGLRSRVRGLAPGQCRPVLPQAPHVQPSLPRQWARVLAGARSLLPRNPGHPCLESPWPRCPASRWPRCPDAPPRRRRANPSPRPREPSARALPRLPAPPPAP